MGPGVQGPRHTQGNRKLRSPGPPPPRVTAPVRARPGGLSVPLGWPTGPSLNQSTWANGRPDRHTHTSTLAQSQGAGRGRDQGHRDHSEQTSHGPQSLPSFGHLSIISLLNSPADSLDLPKIQGEGRGCISFLPLSPQSNPSERKTQGD